MSESIHGSVGTRAAPFSRLVAPRRWPFDDDALFALTQLMDRPDDVGDGPDAEENLFVPAGYTYLGQFVDHDLTLDTTSNLKPDQPSTPTNLRTAAFDLDCVYGDGPSSQPYLYLGDGATLRTGKTIDDPSQPDLLRNTDANGQIDPAGRAIIGDKRNDENSIVSQIQLAFIRFHNQVVAELKQRTPALDGGALFAAARQEVTWTYQRMLLEDFLPRIVAADVRGPFVADWAERGDAAYRLFVPELRDRMPIEFAGAAYRFGHSMVRVGYRLNAQTALPVFNFAGESKDSLTGFQPLPANHVIDDWGRFFPAPDQKALWPGVAVPVNEGAPQVKLKDGGRTGVRLQFAYKIDPNLTGPLGNLPARISGFDGSTPRRIPGDQGPALSLLNLRRGNVFQLASGQSVAAALGNAGGDLHVADLKVRVPAPKPRDALWTFVDVPEPLRQSTPLWLYVLAESQRKIVRKWLGAPHHGKPVEEGFFLSGEGAHTQLGPVGGRIVLETFYGLLDADDRSVLRAAPSSWKPLVMEKKAGPLTFSRILAWTGVVISDGFGA
ncbi:MAG: peroxidase family protein [Leptothrix sp. (in: b-proteobacteria)]